MTQTRKAAPREENSLIKLHANRNTEASEGKLNSMLLRFANGARLNRFEAERLADHILNTTISCLQSRHGITFSRKREKVPNRFGGLTSVNRYWLEGESLERARRIVGLQQEAA